MEKEEKKKCWGKIKDLFCREWVYGGAMLICVFCCVACFCNTIPYSVVYSNGSLVIAFIGILATFVVVSNYVQVKDIEKTVDNAVKEMNEKLSKSDQDIKDITLKHTTTTTELKDTLNNTIETLNNKFDELKEETTNNIDDFLSVRFNEIMQRHEKVSSTQELNSLTKELSIFENLNNKFICNEIINTLGGFIHINFSEEAKNSNNNKENWIAIEHIALTALSFFRMQTESEKYYSQNQLIEDLIYNGIIQNKLYYTLWGFFLYQMSIKREIDKEKAKNELLDNINYSIKKAKENNEYSDGMDLLIKEYQEDLKTRQTSLPIFSKKLKEILRKDGYIYY